MREPHDDPEFGYLVPESIPVGKCSIKQALDFIAEHAAKPTEHTDIVIGKEYNMNPQLVRDILKHFNAFEVHKRETDEEPEVLEAVASKPALEGSTPDTIKT